MTMTRPTFTVSQAADLCQVSRKTITRRLPALQEHGAVKDSMGQWAVPVEALEAVGLRPGRPSVQGRQDSDTGTAVPPPADLAAELAEARLRAAVAEARLDEREKLLAERAQVVESLRAQLRQLEARPEARAESPAPAVVVSEEAQERLVSEDIDQQPATPPVTTGRPVSPAEPPAAPARGSRFTRWLLGRKVDGS